MTALWEAGHPGSCQDGNRHAPGHDEHYTSWAAFRRTPWHGSDPRRQLVFRWDWERWLPRDGAAADAGPDQLRLHIVDQEHADLRSVTVTVTEADEAEVRAWLALRAEVMWALWAPLLPSAAGP